MSLGLNNVLVEQHEFIMTDHQHVVLKQSPRTNESFTWMKAQFGTNLFYVFLSAVYSHYQQLSVRYTGEVYCKGAECLFHYSFSFPQATVSTEGKGQRRGSSVSINSAWTFIVQTSVSCSSPCVYITRHMHSYIHMCAQSCRVEKVLHWFSADCWAGQRNRREREDGKRRTKEEGTEREQRRREQVWPWVFWTEVSGPGFGEGVWSTGGRYWRTHKWETFHLGEVMCSLDGNTVNTHTHTVTRSTNLNTCQDTGGRGNNKTHLIMLVPADTSHANTHAWCECQQTRLPVTTHTVSSAETNRGPGHAETLSY